MPNSTPLLFAQTTPFVVGGDSLAEGCNVKQHLRGELVVMAEGTVVLIAAAVALGSIYKIGYAPTPPQAPQPSSGLWVRHLHTRAGSIFSGPPWMLVSGDVEGLGSPVGI